MSKVLLVDERRVVEARHFVCPLCKRPGDDVLGRVRGPLRDCIRCKTPCYVLWMIQDLPSNKKNKGQQPSSRVKF